MSKKKSNRKYIKVDDLRFIVKALHWASLYQVSLADAYAGEEGGKHEDKALKDSNKCLSIRTSLNKYLDQGNKGVYGIYDKLNKLDESTSFTFVEIKEKYEKEKWNVPKKW